MSASVSRLRDELPYCRGTATSSETALAETIVIFRQTGLLEQCRWHMYGLGVLVQVPLNFPERRFWPMYEWPTNRPGFTSGTSQNPT